MKKFDGAFLDLSGYEIFFEDDFKTYTHIDEMDHRYNPPIPPIPNNKKWYLNAPYDDNFGWGSEQFLKSRVSLIPKGVRLTAKKIAKTSIPVFLNKPNEYQREVNFESGIIRSAPLATLDRNPIETDPNSEFYTGIKYGVFEVRAKMPPVTYGLGIWAAIWLYGPGIEIDLVDGIKLKKPPFLPENRQNITAAPIIWDRKPDVTTQWLNLGPLSAYTGVRPEDYQPSQYYYKGDKIVRNNYQNIAHVYEAKEFVRRTIYENHPSLEEANPILTDQFNTYTVVWTPTEIVFFINGYKIYSQTTVYTEAVKSEKLAYTPNDENKKQGVTYIQIDLQMNSWANVNLGDEVYMDIEYVRIYKPRNYIPPATPPFYEQNPAVYNFRFHDKTTLFNNLSSLNSLVNPNLTELAASDLILGHGGKKLYFRSANNILHNFYFADPNPLDADLTEKWNVSSLSWNKRNVMGNVVLSPSLTEGRLFYRGSVNNNDNKCSVFSFFFDPNNNNPSTDPNALIDPSGWVNENLDRTYVIKNVAGDLVVTPDGKRVYYRNTNGSICYFEKSGTAWQHYDIIVSQALVYNVAGDVILSPSDPQKIYYRGKDGHLWNFYVLGGIWKNEPLDSPYAISNSNVAGDLVYSSIGGKERIYYRGTDSKIYYFQFEIDPLNPLIGIWKRYCLHTEAGVLVNVPTGDALGFLVHSPATQQLFYIDYENRLCNFYVKNGVWEHGSLDWDVKNVAASKYVVLKSGKIFYKGTDGKLHLFYFFNDFNGNGRWYTRSMQHEGSDNVAGNIVVNENDKPFYIGTDGGVWNYYETWSGNYDFAGEEVSID